ncbi:hypothetical protein RKE25_05810 [Dyella sp. BiH032]|uniref:hypothetical protein n=1 Tax=Dyella sp. BiH032 TaxID=3075430 RepID=UPI0028935B2A|nr:hypothetical protein [Dyella sp. BiH032]WNL47147.1 hypothetical protein RKE25_05810 [Dyella sp. BiH032]
MMYALLFAGFAIWFVFSVHPGSLLGFALTGGDWLRLLRGLHAEEKQTKAGLRSAAARSLAVQSVLAGLGLLGSYAAGVHGRGETFAVLAAVLGGLVAGYVSLLWMTRPRGGYGYD